MDLGAAARSARRAVGMTQSDLAERAGVSRQAIALLESNRGRVSTLRAASRHIQFRIANLARGDEFELQVRTARHRLKLTQAALAQRAGLSIPTVRSVEKGGGSVISLSRIVEALAPKARNKEPFRASWQVKKDVRFTPPQIVAQVRQAFGDIDLDPCGDPRSFVGATSIIAEEQDGLTSAWSGRVAFVNPPFSDLTAWINRCADAYENGEVATVIGLFPARTESATFQDRVFEKADVLLLRGRVCFFDEKGAKMAAAPFAIMFCVWGGDADSVATFAEVAGCSTIWAPRPFSSSADCGQLREQGFEKGITPPRRVLGAAYTKDDKRETTLGETI